MSACGFRILALISLALSSSQLLSATTPVPSAPDPGYIAALAVADHFLEAWQSNDENDGIVLLSERARKNVDRNDLDRFFSASSPSAYEINRGKRLRRGRYEFPVVLVEGIPARGSSSAHPSSKPNRKFSSIVVVDTGNNDWAVDKLP